MRLEACWGHHSHRKVSYEFLKMQRLLIYLNLDLSRRRVGRELRV